MNDDNSDFKKAYDFTFSRDRDTAENSLNSNLNINSFKLSFKLDYSQQDFSEDFNQDNSANNSNDENYVNNRYSSLFDPDSEISEEDSSIFKINLSDNSQFHNQKDEENKKNKDIFVIIKEIEAHNGNDNKKYLFSNVTNYDSSKREIKDIIKKKRNTWTPKKKI